MILYFTGTGNSKYVANALGHRLNDEVVSLNTIIKYKRTARFRSDKAFVIVAPIYAWRLPRVVEDLLKETEFIGNKNVYFVGTMVSQSGNCDKYCKKICEKIGVVFKGFCGVPMPNNYVVSDVMPDEKKVKEVLSAARPILDEIAHKIENEENIEKSDKTPVAWILSGVVNSAFNKFMVSSKDFVVSDKCISCCKCAKYCPVNNINIVDGKPTFGDKCINCYSCIHHCPMEAINIKGKTENHGRYVCPEYNGD